MVAAQGKLLKFPKVDPFVFRNCQVCYKEMPIPVDIEAKWGDDEMLCFACYLWSTAILDPETFLAHMTDALKEPQ